MDLSARLPRARQTLVAMGMATLVALGGFGAIAARADALGPECTNALLPTPADVVAGSCFQAKNGTLAPTAAPVGSTGTRTDWTTTTALGRTQINDDTGDSQYTGGKEQSPLDWTFSTAAGVVSPSKSDIVKAVLSKELVDDNPLPAVTDAHLFVYMAFLLQGDSGNQNTNIEFNQLGTTLTTNGVTFPRRSQGDVLVTYDGATGNIRVGMCTWRGDYQGQTSPADTDGWYDLDGNGPLKGSEKCTELDATKALGSTNSGGALTNATAIPSFPDPIPVNTFGELSIDLSESLADVLPANDCVNFGQVFIHSRTSDAVDSSKNDIIQPVQIPGLGTCSIAVEKQVSVDEGVTWHDADTAATAPITETTNDLDYQIVVENTGSEDVTVDDSDITDPNCTGMAPTTPVVIAAGQTATWTCTKAPGSFTPGGSYTNTATVSAKVGTGPGAFVIPDVSDVAIAGFKAQPTVSTQASASVEVGGVASDTATINGGVSPGGTVTFRLYGPDDATCSGNPVWTSPARTVTAGGAASGDSPALTTAGTYRWIASYSGDVNNQAAAGACNDPNESVVIAKDNPDITTSASFSGNGQAGSTSSDTVTVDGFGATGTVRFRLYGPDDANCTGTPVYDSGLVNLVNEQASSGNSPALNEAGVYRWVAIYSGDTNNEAETHPCNSANENVTIAKKDAAISTNASLSGDSQAGSTSSDSVTVDGVNATGTVDFSLYGPDDATCSGTPVYTANNVALSGETASSGASGALGAGTYRWVVHYDGDANNAAETHPCNSPNETVTVAKKDAAISTLASLTGDGEAGSTSSDSATVDGFNATGTVDFTLYGPDDENCDGPVVFTANNVALSNETASSGASGPLGAGTYNWVAHYDGDANNLAETHPCGSTGESVTVDKKDADITTSASLSGDGEAGSTSSDSITVDGFNTTGTVDFTLYGPGDTDCTGTPVFTANNVALSGEQAVSGASGALGAGKYRWVAHYDGDANNEAETHPCNSPDEDVTVAKKDADISTNASLSGDGSAGSTSSDSVTVDGFAAGGTVDFALYGVGDTDCSGTPVYTADDVALSNEAAVSGASGALNAAGKYRWVVHYDGDANNASETHPCNSPNEDVTVGKANPSLSTNASNTITLGKTIHDVATLSGGVSPGGTITFRLYGPGDGDCSETAIFTSEKTVTGNGDVTSASYTPTAKGRYHWTAEYSGDANNDDESHACGAANEDVLVQAAAYDIVKDGPEAAHPGDEVTFTYEITNTGDPQNEADMSLENVDVSDDKCSPVEKVSDLADDVLDPGESWDYECTMVMPSGQSHTNVATLKADDPRGDPLPPDTDTHTVDLLNPSVEVTKTGPGSAPAGSAVPFTITIENTGDVAFEDDTVTMADPKCAQAPALQGKAEQGGGEDASPGTLDPGDVWTYTCSVQTSGGDTTLENTATGGGTDPLGKPVGDSGSATTTLIPPPVQAAQSRNPTGTAEFVRQPKKECISKRFRYDVAGRDIKRVTFSIDGKVERVMTKPDARGRWSLHVNPLLRSSKRHRLTVQVEFTDASNTQSKTLSVFYKRCTCLSRRAFPIRLRKQFGEDLKSAKVYVNGKRVQTIRTAKRLKAPVRLVGLPKGRFTVKITAVTVSGRKVSGTRRYYTCKKKLKGGIPKL